MVRAPAVPQSVHVRIPEPLFCRHCVPDWVPGQVYDIPFSPVVPEMLSPLAKVEDADAESPVNVEKPPWVIPPANVEVAVLVMLRSPEERMLPPVIVRPAELASPAEEIPPAKVLVAVEEELSPPPSLRSPEIFTPLENVELAATIIELDAERIPLSSMLEEKVEEAVEESPPVSERRVEVAELEFTWVNAS